MNSAPSGNRAAVVHTAGRAVGAPLADLDLDALDALHRTNIRGAFVVTPQAVRRLRDGASLVNFQLGRRREAASAFVGRASSF